MIKFIHSLRRTHIYFSEAILWICFLGMFIASLMLRLDRVQDIMLVIGTICGLICLWMLVQETASYKKNKASIKIWGYRFVLFKVLPIVLYLIFSYR